LQRGVQQHVSREFIYIGSREIGKVLETEWGMFYVDVALNPFQRNQGVFMFIDKDGKVEPIFEGMVWRNRYLIKRETEGLPPSRELWSFSEFIHTPQVDLSKVFDMAKEVLEETVVFHDRKLYDLVTAWCMYTWLRGLFPKNINVYFLGFPATGKSQALKFCKKFARYVVDYDPSAEKSYKWNISYTLGVLAIDEAEYITKVKASKLRKYHEAGVIETRLIGLPLVGLTPIDLRVDAPLVLSATHPPADTAFLQRGFIVRMVKGSPKIKDFDLIPDLEERRRMFAKSTLCSWFKIYESLNRVYFQLSFKNIDERIKDLALPICVILEALGKDWEWVLEYAKYSFAQANFITPETTAFIQALILMVKEAKLLGDKYVLNINKVMDIISKTARLLGAQPSRLDYLKQYLFAGCEIAIVNDELCYVCDAKTVNAIIKELDILKNQTYRGEPIDIHETLGKADVLTKSLLKAVKEYIVANNLDYKVGVIEVPLKEVRSFMKPSGYAKMGYSLLVSRVKKKFIEFQECKWLESFGVRFKLKDGKDVALIVDLDAVKDKFELIDSLCGGGNDKNRP